MARVTCNTVDEAVRALDEQFGYNVDIKTTYRRSLWGLTDVEMTIEDVPEDHKFDWGTYSNTVTVASDLTMESLQKAIADMERRKLEHPGVKLTINPTHVEIPVPPGWTREMVEDMMYYQDALSEVSSLARGSAEDQPKYTHSTYSLGVIISPELQQEWEQETPETTGLDSLADVLPDLYGRKEHAAYMERMAQAEREQKMEKASSLGHALGRVMDGLCGKHRGMED